MSFRELIINYFYYRSVDRNSTITNQTEFLYTVFVGNKPVLAITAAEDMKLVSTAEVVRTLGSPVLTKSERKFVFAFPWLFSPNPCERSVITK